MKNSYIGQAWLVILLSAIFGVALAGVQSTLSPKIKQNKLNDTLSQIPSLVPGATTGEPAKVGDLDVYKAMDGQGQQVGWVIPARGLGFADVLELLVGVNADVTQITGLYVLDQKETPGLGNKITEDVWREQFKNKPLAKNLVVTKTTPAAENEIQGVTGATISSSSVVGILNGTIARFRAALGAGEQVQ